MSVERKTNGKPLTGKSALVTGGSRGIGKAIAIRLGRNGALVAVHYGRNRAAAEDTVKEIQGAGGEAFAVEAALTPNAIPGVIQKLFATLDSELKRRTGETGLDVLVNNAGIAPRASVQETTEAVFDELFAVNVKAPLFITQQALRRLRDGGRIINISSAVARIAFPDIATYAMTKGALNTLTLNLAKQLGPRGITANSVAPGVIDTDMNAGWLSDPNGRASASAMSALGRVGRPDDVAGVVAFLASDDSRWVTGQVLDASGGSLLG